MSLIVRVTMLVFRARERRGLAAHIPKRRLPRLRLDKVPEAGRMALQHQIELARLDAALIPRLFWEF